MKITLGKGPMVVSFKPGPIGGMLGPSTKKKDQAFNLYVASGRCTKRRRKIGRKWPFCTGENKAWSKKGTIKSGALVVWYNAAANKVIDCSDQRKGCSVQPYPVPKNNI